MLLNPSFGHNVQYVHLHLGHLAQQYISVGTVRMFIEPMNWLTHSLHTTKIFGIRCYTTISSITNYDIQ